MADTERIKKLLKLTTSPYNGEALNAIRKANEEIKGSGQTWDDVIEGKDASRRIGSFVDDTANKWIIQNVRKQSDELRSERDEYKRDYWLYKNKYDNIIRGKQTEKKEDRQSEFSEKEAKGYTQHGEYVPKSKRGRR